MPEPSTKPYLMRAIYDWCVDSGYTPYLSVTVDSATRVPMEYVKDGQIVNHPKWDHWTPKTVGTGYEFTKTLKPLEEKDAHLPSAANHYQDWLDCIRSRQRCICDVEVGARSVTVCHLGNLAYWNHRKLRWDPKEWRFVNDAEADNWLDRERRAGYQLPKV